MKASKEEREITLAEHLNELRGHILKSVIFLIVCSVIIYGYVDKIIPALLRPVGKLVFIAPQEAFASNIKIAFLGGLLLSSPFILYQVWKFISSGLTTKERRYVYIFGPFSFLLFVLGFVFGYFVIVPLGTKFLLGFATDFVSPMITISKYISFVFNLAFAFALLFQLPLVLPFLTKIGIVTPAMLTKRRREAIVLVFIAAAVFTPPDVITQVLMAAPLILLYEIGIIFSKLVYKQAIEERVAKV